MSDKTEQVQLENNISQESLVEAVSNGGYCMMPIEMNVDNLSEIQIDKESFEKGVKSASKVAGILTTLINCGLDSKLALDYVLNSDTIEMSLKLEKIKKETQIEVSKQTNKTL